MRRPFPTMHCRVQKTNLTRMARFNGDEIKLKGVFFFGCHLLKIMLYNRGFLGQHKFYVLALLFFPPRQTWPLFTLNI